MKGAEVGGLYAEVAAAQKAYADQELLNSMLGARSAEAPIDNAPQQQTTNSNPPTANGSCEHGIRVYKTGSNSNGNWAGMFCPANVNGCKPVWKKA